MIDFNDTTEGREAMMRASSWYWATAMGIKLLGDTRFTLKNCLYMGKIMDDDSRFVVVMKGTQARITTAFMLRSIHCLKYGLYPQGVIYYFPSRDAVEDFSKTRFTPLINDNPCIKKHLKSTDSVFVKKVNKAFLTLKGATATKNIKGRKKDSMAVRSTPADEAILDERDLFDQAIVDMIPDRLLNSKFKRIVNLGSPTIPDFGISKCFDESDQKFSLIKCEGCGGWTNLALEFPNSVKYKRATTHEEYAPFFACVKCGKQIDPFSGDFVAKYPGREHSGYHVPHLITPHCEVQMVMNRWAEAQADGSKLGTFYNSILGLPYIPAEDRLTHSDVYACCGNDIMRTELSVGETAAGVDIGKAYHTVLIGNKIDDKRGKVIYACRVKGFDKVYDLFIKYNVKSGVVCLRPYEEEFGKFQAACSLKNIQVYGSEYSPNYRQKSYMKTDEKAGIYTLHKTQAFDKSHSWVKNGLVEFPRKCEEIDVMVEQLCNCAKVLEEDETTGDRLYKYIKLGPDHYRSALNYFQIALDCLTHYQGMSAHGKMVATGSYDPLNYGL